VPLVFAGCLLAGSVSAAEGVASGDIAAAEALFRDAKVQLAAGKLNEACEKFAESERLDPSSGTLINLARCHEQQGKLATAWAEFLAAERLSTAQHKPNRAAEAARRAKNLAEHLSYLTVTVAHALPGMEIRRDDVLLEAGSIGLPIPVDPGVHYIVVSAPGYEATRLDVIVAPESNRQTIEVPELVQVPPPAPEPPVVAPPAQKPAPVAARPPAPAVVHRSEKDRTLGWVVGGAGVAFATTGGVFYFLALSANEKAQGDCAYEKHYGCGAEAATNGAKRDTFATLATISGALGIVGLGAGLWLILSPPEHSGAVRAGAPAPAPVRLGIAGSSLVVRGAF
jgi:tetratricopeptide (TPR) repeat protein